MEQEEEMKDKITTIILILSVLIFLLGNVIISYMSYRSTKDHYAKMEAMDKEYKIKSIEISEQFNLEVKALGE